MPSSASLLWLVAAAPSVMLPISILVINCRPCRRSALDASIICKPACAVSVPLALSIPMICVIFDMSTMVPSVETQGVSE